MLRRQCVLRSRCSYGPLVDGVEAGLIPSVPLDDGLIPVTATITCTGGTLFPLSRVIGDGYAKVRRPKERSVEIAAVL